MSTRQCTVDSMSEVKMLPMPINEFTGAYRFLSNFYPCPNGILLDGALYPTVEHAFQAAKTTEQHHRDLIRQCATPGQAKRLGRSVPLRHDWEQVKISIMH